MSHRLRAVIISVVLLILVAALPAGSPALGAPAAPGWHVDFLLDASRVHDGDSAAAVRWDSTGTVIGWEVDVEPEFVALQYVTGTNFGTFVVWAKIVDGQVHRVHLDATQEGADVVVRMYLGGWLAYPFVLRGQTLGRISHARANPVSPIRQASTTVSVDQLTAS